MQLKDTTPGFLEFLKDIKKYVGEPRCILDCGSRDGNESQYFLKEFPAARIHAFEPSHENYKLCEAATNGTKIHLWKLALSNYEGQAKFFYTPSNIGASSLLKPSFIPWSNDNTVIEETVEVTTLDKWAEENGAIPDVLLVDVQGNEGNLFKGAIKVLENVKIIYSEMGTIPYYENHTLIQDIIPFLESCGFSVIRNDLDWTHESNVTLVKNYLL